MKISNLILAAALIVTLLMSADCFAGGKTGDPAQTQTVLNALLASSNDLIPPESSCSGQYGQEGPAKIKDLLSTQLAYLYQGKNKITGKCTGKNKDQCLLSITHSSGEDVASAQIKFILKNDKVDLSTLSCVITP